MIQRIIDTIFPPLCIHCGKNLKEPRNNNVICKECSAHIPLYDSLYCPTCLRRVPKGDTMCHKKTPYLLAPSTHYEQRAVQRLIHQMKYEGWLTAAQETAKLMITHLASLGIDWGTWHAVPIPLHHLREFERGFNQSAVLAGHISTAFNIPLITKNLIRTRATSEQAKMKSYREREENMIGAFHAQNPTEFMGKNILLVDDVTTSGATLYEAVKTLKSCGAKKIIATVAARAR